MFGTELVDDPRVAAAAETADLSKEAEPGQRRGDTWTFPDVVELPWEPFLMEPPD